MSDLNSVDLAKLKDALDSSARLRGGDGEGLWGDLSDFVTLHNDVLSRCRVSLAAQVSVAKLSALLNQWASTDGEGQIVYDLLIKDQSGVATFSGGQVLAYLKSLGIERPEITADPGELLGLPPTSGYADDPVCTANGNFVHQETDLKLVGFATLIEPARTYNALAHHRPGVFGLGWSSLLDMRLTSVGPDLVRVTLADGAEVPFHWDVELGQYRTNFRRGLALDGSTGDNGSGGWRLSSNDDRSWTFDHEGRLVGGTSGHASFVVDRETDGQVGLTENLSRRWVRYFLGPQGLVERARSSDGREASFTYIEDGHCLRVDRPSGPMVYDVVDGRIASITDADGVALVHNTYDDQGRVVSQVNAQGRAANYEYLINGMTRITYGAGGPTNLYAHDQRGNLTAAFGGDGAAQRMWWDDRGRLVRVVERGGPETAYEFASDHPRADRKLLVRRIDPDGLAESYEYDDLGRVITETGRDGVVQRFAYDGVNTVPSRIIDPDGSEIVATFDDSELPLAFRDADGVETRMLWDGDGQLVAVISATGARSALMYDEAGRLARITDPMGRERSFRYDGGGRLVSVTDPEGLTTTYTYSAAGRAISCSTAGPGSWVASYNDAGLVATFTDAAGAVSGFIYDDFGQLVAQTDPTGATFRRELDSLGRLLAVIDPMGATTRYEYGPTGDLSAVVDADGRRWSREIDRLGRTARLIGPGGRTTRWTYHPNGEIASVTDPTGHTTIYTIDDQGRLVSETGPAGNSTLYAYSPGGRLTSVMTAAGRVYRFTNDAAGRMVEFTDPDGEAVTAHYRPDGQVSEFVAEGGTTSIRYDDVGRVTGWSATDRGAGPEAVFFPNAAELSKAGATPARFNFDSRGLLSSVADPTGVVTQFVSDLRGFVTRVTTGPSSSAFTYDAAGNLEAATDPLGVTTRFRWSPAGRIEAVSIGDQFRLGYRYDDDGNIAGLRSADGIDLVTYGYDDRGALTGATNADGSVSIARDATGRIVQTTDLAGRATTYLRDADGMVIERSDATGNAVRYARTPAGDLAGFVDPVVGEVVVPPERQGLSRDAGGRILADGEGRTYRYDDAGRLVEATNAAGERWAFTYNDYGLLATDETPTLGRRTFRYDAAGAVEQVLHTDGTTIDFTCDLAGRRVGEHRSDGSRVDYVWDALDQLIRITRTDSQGQATSTEMTYSGLGRVERVDDVEIGWDDGIYGKPVALGSQRFLRSGTQVRPCAPAADWDDGIGDDPFGLTEIGALVGLGYRGELTVDGLVFMGDRIYDPATRSFLSRDPLPQVPGEVAFISSYVYAYNDPVNYLDPTGRRPLTEDEFQAVKTEMEKTAWNKYGSTIVHTTLDVAGMVPMFGEVADGLNAVIYLAEGDYAAAAISLAAMVPILGGGAVAAKYATKTAKQGKKAQRLSKFLNETSHVKDFENLGGEFVDDGLRMVDLPLRAGPRKPGPLLWPEGPHNQTILDRINKLKADGMKHVGGGSRVEETILTPSGKKLRRRLDITMETPEGSMYREQIGRTKADGSPVKREVEALDDIERATGHRPIFTPYD